MAYTVKTEVQVKSENVEDAVMKGLNRIDEWAQIISHNKTSLNCTFLYELCFTDGGFIEIVLNDNNSKHFDEIFRLDKWKIQDGLQIMADKYNIEFYDIVKGDINSYIGKVLLQCSIFGGTFNDKVEKELQNLF